ncbi:ATP-binding protein [Rhizobiaceae bacterium]|nr:ATP-binding protein [Rhizobiaceae bacterium]
MPTGLFGRSLIIIVAPMVLLQTVVAFVFMERHWQSVTDRLSAAVVREVSGIVEIIETYPQDADFETITRIAERSFDLQIRVLPDAELPPPKPKPFFSVLDSALANELTSKVKKPFWIDTVGDSDLLEIRLRLDAGVLRIFVKRKQAYASNTHIFLLWMVGAAAVLILIAVLFLRNQVRPIQRLAEAAERFGRGQAEEGDLTPRGAAEVRRATASFVQMRDRVERAVDQRTAMLAGVSHDLRTVLTRFRLQLAMSQAGEDRDEMVRDVDDMQNMLQGYLDFARGDAGEAAAPVDVPAVLHLFGAQADAADKEYLVSYEGSPSATLRPTAFRRLVGNLVTNALRHAESVEVRGRHGRGELVIEVHDDGPGIAEADRDRVFKPFVRLDESRNQDEGGTGLGLAIARDIVHTHGGAITLDDSPLGGLTVRVVLPA